jgi:ornithine cyclodeaminase
MMTRIITLAEIETALPAIDVVGEIEKGFVAYSEGKVTVPPVGELLFPNDNGELHIKYGAIDGDDVAVVKIATGFYDNPKRGLPPFGGMNIVFSARTGLPEAVLLDGGALTNIRTAAAGAVAAKHLGPKKVTAIGILGSGTQARLQADYLRRVTECRVVTLWGRDRAKTEDCAADLRALGFTVSIKGTPADVAQSANLIVTTTASHNPLLRAADIKPGTHITAMGSDTPEKAELDPEVLGAASAVVADSIPQCLVRGEIHRALKAGAISEKSLVELGAVISGKAKGRRSENDITVADLTGVAVQDIMIAKAVLARL